MAKQTRMRSYYRAVCARAAKDALGLARRKGVEAGSVVTVLAVLAAAVLDRGVNVVHAIFAAGIALAGFVVLVFVANLIRTPLLLANDAANIADDDRRALEAEIADMQGNVTRLRTELDRITSLPVPDRHRSALRDFVANVRREFDNPHPAFVRAPSDEHSLLLSSVSAHFPALAVAVATHLHAQERLQDARQALISRIQRECGNREIDEPPYKLDQVYASLWPGLFDIAEGWRPAGDHRFVWRWEADPAPPGARSESESVTVRRQESPEPFASLPAAPSDDLAGRVAVLTSRVEALFIEAQAWDESGAIRDAYHALMALLPDLRATARLAAEREMVRMTPGCPICADQIGQE